MTLQILSSKQVLATTSMKIIFVEGSLCFLQTLRYRQYQEKKSQR